MKNGTVGRYRTVDREMKDNAALDSLSGKNARILAALFLKHPEGLLTGQLHKSLPKVEADNIEKALFSLAGLGYLMKLPEEGKETTWKINPDFMVGQLERQLHSLGSVRNIIKEIIIISESETNAYEELHEFTGAYIKQVENLIEKWYAKQR